MRELSQTEIATFTNSILGNCGVGLNNGPGPVPSSNLAQKAGLVEDIDLWEINEAFAGQCVACIKDLGIEPQ